MCSRRSNNWCSLGASGASGRSSIQYSSASRCSPSSPVYSTLYDDDDSSTGSPEACSYGGYSRAPGSVYSIGSCGTPGGSFALSRRCTSPDSDSSYEDYSCRTRNPGTLYGTYNCGVRTPTARPSIINITERQMNCQYTERRVQLPYQSSYARSLCYRK